MATSIPMSVVYDRKHKAAKKGVGLVELQIRLLNGSRKHIRIAEVPPAEWPAASSSDAVREVVNRYTLLLSSLPIRSEEVTLDVLNAFLEPSTSASAKEEVPAGARVVPVKTVPCAKPGRKKVQAKAAAPCPEKMRVIDFIRDEMSKEKLAWGTMRHKQVFLNSFQRFGKIKWMSDVTPENIKAYDDWLRADGDRTDVTVYGYHKRLKMYVNLMFQLGYISKNPYSIVTISRGRSKERQPLTEEELIRLRNYPLTGKEERVRDLFIFAAYTGLSFCDAQAFDFDTMTEKHGDMYYIDGSRLKTGTTYFTPILAPAMEVLKKYNFKLPHISNQKCNDYLHLLESRMGLNKPLTFHVARHSFATLSLSHDVPIEKVARMLGHTDIKTTQIYAKIMKSTIERHSELLASSIL